MKNYSFSNIANQETFATRKSNDFSNIYRHSELKAGQANQRIEEIKKKYDTPSRRERIESLKKSKDYELLSKGVAKQQARGNSYQHKPAPTFGNNLLKQSFALNRLEKSTLKNDFDSKDFMNSRVADRDYRRSNEKQNDFNSYKGNNREEEEAIFSKVREMKQSIINNDYMKSSINGRSSIASGKYPQYGENKLEIKKQYDPRVQNIDKINSKIKQILSCLSQNEKNPSKYIKDSINTSTLLKEDPSTNKQSAYFGNKSKEISSSKRSYESHFHKSSDVLQKYNVFGAKPPVQQPKEVPRSSYIQGQKYSKFQPQNSKSNLDYEKYKNRDYSANRTESYTKNLSATPQYKREQELTRTPSYLNKDYLDSRGLKASRSKSQIDSFKKSTLNVNQNGDVLRSGKKLNDQISRIQRKIQQFQKEKRKLNIEFTPFTLKNKSTANLGISWKAERQSEGTIEGDKNNQQSRTSLSKYGEQRSSSYDCKFKSYMNKASSYEEKYGDFTNKTKDLLPKEITKNSSIYGNSKPQQLQLGDFQLKIQQIQVKTVRVDNNIESNQEENMNNARIQFDSAAIKKRTDEGIEYRRKRLQGQDDIIKTQTLKKIVTLFCEQVKLDENFRNLKIWFQSCFQSDKFSKIMRNLQNEGVKMSLKECEAIFTVDQSENNPFFSVQGFSGSYESLTSAYFLADRHWKNKIQHKFDQSSLISEGFSCQKIDLQRKGFIELEDLVRFLNIQSGTFYRNRDLFLIFNRFTASEKLNFESLLSQVCA